MDLREYFVLLNRGGPHRISIDKINELVEHPISTTPIGAELELMGYVRSPPTAQTLISLYVNSPQTFANELVIHGEWVKATSNHNISTYLMRFTKGPQDEPTSLYLEVMPDSRRIRVIMKRIPFQLVYSDLDSFTQIVNTLLTREIRADVPESRATVAVPAFCFYDRLLNFMDTPEKRVELREFKDRLLRLFAFTYIRMLRGIVNFINLNAPLPLPENRLRADELPIMTTDNDKFREMVKIRLISNLPDAFGVKKKNRKRHFKKTSKKPRKQRMMSNVKKAFF
jgi:hypothetical protein